MIVATLMISMVGTAVAQPVPDENTLHTFLLVGVPLEQALDRLIDETRISLVYETRLVQDKTTFCRAREKTREQVLECLLKDTGLQFARLSSGTYILLPNPLTESQYGTLRGRVTDADTGTPLADANVFLARDNTGTTTNAAGRFAFPNLMSGPHAMIVTHVAYHDASDTIWVDPRVTRNVNVAMSARTIITAPVVITAFSSRLPSENLGAGRIDADAFDAVGSADLVQDVDAIVGVQSGDALSDVHVQGGATGEHQYLLDGATVFVPIRNGGFFGPFSPFAVQQITVQKAGFDAAQGSYLSGVVEVEHRVSSGERRELVLQADPLNVNARGSGRVAVGRNVNASWMLAARSAIWEVHKSRRLENLFDSWSAPDLFLAEQLSGSGSDDPFVDAQSVPAQLDFNDIHAAIRLQINQLHGLHFSFYRGQNTFGDNLPRVSETHNQNTANSLDEYTWTNITRQLNYEGVLGSRLFANAHAWMSSYQFQHPFDRSPFDAGSPEDPQETPGELNDIDEIGVRFGADYAAGSRHVISGGVEGATIDSELSLALDPTGTTPDVSRATRKPVRWRAAAFVEDKWSLGQRTSVTVGTRLTFLPLLNQVFGEPRISAQYDHPAGTLGAWSMRVAAGLYRQFINQFDASTYSANALVPTVRFWSPVSRGESPQRAWHATGAVVYIPASRWQFGIESFYKYQPHLLVLDYGGISNGDVSGPLADAQGKAYGVGVSAKRESAVAIVSAQYEYARARRRIGNRFENEFRPVPWDAPHRFVASADIVPSRHFTVTIRWSAVVGRAWGFRQAYYDYLEPNASTRVFGEFDLSDPGSHRLPAYSRVDIGVAYSRRIKQARLQTRVSLINLGDRKNVRDWNLVEDEAAQTFVRQPRYSTPFVPSFSLRVSV